MEDILGLGYEFLQQRLIRYASTHEVDVRMSRQLFDATGVKVVENADASTVLDE